ncbi:hypothetical protein ABIC63_000488 [Pseudacidovorax sp. 1753]|uniref:holin n=1 Tax=Pseudacidovorax sp. 1753 TaxID=3156419 RepID=UPI003390D76D
MAEPNTTLGVTDAAIASTASKVTYTAAGTTIWAWVTSSEAGIVMGILIGLMGLVVNAYFRWRDFQLNKQVQLAKIDALNRSGRQVVTDFGDLEDV